VTLFQTPGRQNSFIEVTMLIPALIFLENVFVASARFYPSRISDCTGIVVRLVIISRVSFNTGT